MASRLERLSQIGIIVIALSAVVVSIWQVRIVQNHNKLSVRPLIDYATSSNGETKSIQIVNNGIGPAIIKRITYSYGGNEYLKLEDVLKASSIDTLANHIGEVSDNTIMAPNSTITLLDFRPLDQNDSNIEVQVEYQSIYEESFELKMSF